MLLDKLEQIPWQEYFDLEVLKQNLLIQDRDTTEDYLEDEIESARQEWLEAKQYFNLVSDPDLVEHAIYSLEAAEKKYNYLLKQKKRNN